MAICKPSSVDISDLTPSTHEEADVRIFLHLRHAESDGHTDIFIKEYDSGDTNIIYIINLLNILKQLI